MAVILLAAGRSRRFGGNKLAALLHGKPVIHHAAATLAALPCDLALVVSTAETPDVGGFGFRDVRMATADAPLSASIARGVDAAAKGGATSVLIALADMPFVPAAHYAAMIRAFAEGNDRVATRGGGTRQPPAIFGSRYFEDLRQLTGDSGARALLSAAHAVALDTTMTRDIDTEADLHDLGSEPIARGL